MNQLVTKKCRFTREMGAENQYRYSRLSSFFVVSPRLSTMVVICSNVHQPNAAIQHDDKGAIQTFAMSKSVESFHFRIGLLVVNLLLYLVHMCWYSYIAVIGGS